MKIIAGLGNPGQQYIGTRHNIGFDFIDVLAKKYNIDVNIHKFRAFYGNTRIENEKVILIKPITYMNLSGESIAQAMSFYKLDVDDLIVVYDDIDLDVGKIRIREKGSAGGHNGIKNIIAHLGTNEFKRIRIGVGTKPPRMDLADYVLSPFKKDEGIEVDNSIDLAVKACEMVLKEGIMAAMNSFNGR